MQTSIHAKHPPLSGGWMGVFFESMESYTKFFKINTSSANRDRTINVELKYLRHQLH